MFRIKPSKPGDPGAVTAPYSGAGAAEDVVGAGSVQPLIAPWMLSSA